MHFRSTEAVLSAEIYNMAGQLVTSVAKVADNKINAQSLAKEMYIVKVQTAAGTQTVKFLKD
ncbi:T9SS type A sorting domain-containing protein [Chryseobacterium salipaludis]|uniref:T9SS type A sorting domain-containing protein n=1 Tax=Chryseobacterium TaxID=59732 RepID=UPI0022593687|nr:T9SS type A sorting domain-containing protein [Planobacterium sp. JC490]MCX3295933.1 T9SS type A sorting domain-containing protein [Planobacterium sp. JC490]